MTPPIPPLLAQLTSEFISLPWRTWISNLMAFLHSTAPKYGAIRKITDQNIGTLSAAWHNITLYQTLGYGGNSEGIIYNLTDGDIGVISAGPYQVIVNFESSFTQDNNTSRSFQVRLFDMTDNVPVPEAAFTQYIGGYTAGTTLSVTLAGNFTKVFEGKLLRLQVGNASADFAAFTIHACSISLIRVTGL